MKNSGLLSIIFVLSILLTSCSEDKSAQNPLLFSSDFESLKGWGNSVSSSLIKGIAHSGFYSAKVDSLNLYSDGFKLNFAEISSKPVKKLKISAWCYVKNLGAQGQLVFGVKKPNLPDYVLWNGIKIHDTVKEANKWVEVTGEVDLGQLGNAGDNFVEFYCWNNSKEEIYMDDVKLEFVE